MNSQLLSVLLLTSCGIVCVNGDNDINGIQTNSAIGSTGSGYFNCDAKSLFNSAGHTGIGLSSLWYLYGSQVTVAEGNRLYMGHEDTGAFGCAYTSAEMWNSSVRLISNSFYDQLAYTRSTFVLSTVQLDNSDSFIKARSNVSVYQSELSLQGSTLETGESNEVFLQGSKVAITASNIRLGDLNELAVKGSPTVTVTQSTVQTGRSNQINLSGTAALTMLSSSTLQTADGNHISLNGSAAVKMTSSILTTGTSNEISFSGTTSVTMTSSTLTIDNSNQINIADSTVEPVSNTVIQTGSLNTIDLQGATLTMAFSKITTGQGSEIRMASKSLLSANPLNLTIGDHSAFIMGPGSSLYSVGSNSSIKIGERAVLNVVGICFFQGNLLVPDYTVKVIGKLDLPVGFTCMPTLSALKIFMRKVVE